LVLFRGSIVGREEGRVREYHGATLFSTACSLCAAYHIGMHPPAQIILSFTLPLSILPHSVRFLTPRFRMVPCGKKEDKKEEK
jgi:hypothetical protein